MDERTETTCTVCRDKGTVTSPSSITESCHHCDAHDLAWSVYYAWLDTLAQEKRRKTAGNAAATEPTTMWQQLAARAKRERAERLAENPMHEVNEEVSSQFKRFETALSELIKSHYGKWIVWLDEPRSFHDDEQAALRWAYENLDTNRGWVIACVETPRVHYASGWLRA